MKNSALNTAGISLAIHNFEVFLGNLKVKQQTVSIYAAAIFAFLSQITKENEISLSESLAISEIDFLDTLDCMKETLQCTETEARKAFLAWQEFGKSLQSDIDSSRSSLSSHELLIKYTQALEQEERSPNTIKNYCADLRSFFEYFASYCLSDSLRKPAVKKYFDDLKKQGLSAASIERKTSVLRQFFTWAVSKGYALQNPLKLETNFRPIAPQEFTASLPLWLRNIGNSRLGKFGNRMYRKYNSYRFATYLNIILVVFFLASLTLGGLRQFFITVLQSQAFPTSLTRPTRTLSFQARLTDAAGTPITSVTNMNFGLWTLSSGGSSLYTTGVCSITPDSDGIFSTLIGSSCGSEIASSVFSENQQVWLEVTVGAETLTPRQQIATVGYALNSETLQGYPASASAVENTIPVMNNSGQIVLGAASPSLISNSGTFAIKSNALSIVTNTGSGGNITIAPDGTGQVSVLGGTTSTNTFTVSNANLSTGNLITGSVGNNNTGYNLLTLQSGSSPTTKFNVDALGNVIEKGYLSAPGATISATYSSATPLIINGTGGQIFSIANSGSLTLNSLNANGGVLFTNGSGVVSQVANASANTILHGGTSPTFSAVSLSADVTGTLPINNGGTNGTATPTAGAIAYGTGTAYAFNSAGTGGQCLVSGGTGTPTWGTCGGANFWQLNNGVLSSGNSTNDLAVGGNATSSALFQVFGLTGNATMAGSLTTNVIQPPTGPLTLNYKSSPSTWGTALTIQPTTGNIGIGTSNPLTNLDVGGNLLSRYKLSLSRNDGSDPTATKTWNLDNNGNDLRIFQQPNLSTAGNVYLVIKDGGNIGIGNGVSPTAPLQISSGFGANAALIVNNLNSGDLFAASASGITKFRIQNNGTLTDTNYTTCNGLTSDASGNFSCNTNAYANINFWQLNSGVLSPGSSTNDLSVGGNSTSSALFQVFGNTGSATMAGTLTSSTIQSPTGPLTLNYKSGPNAWGAALTIQPTTGNVGIGTTNPQYPLDVNGDINLTSTQAIRFGGLGALGGDTYTTYLNSTGTNGIVFRNSSAGNLGIVSNSGNFGIGTISPGSKLDLQGGYLNVSGGATISGTYVGSTVLTVNGNSSIVGNLTGLTGLSSSGSITFSSLTNQGGVLYAGVGGLIGANTAGSGGQCLVSGGTGAPTWSTCGGANYWQLDPTLKVVSPGNSTWDLTVGGNSTSSALFQVFGLTGNASMAGTLTTSTIQPPTGPLTLNYKSGANSWAAGLTIQPTTGYVGITNANPKANLDVAAGTTTTNTVINATGSINSFLQANIQNTSSAANAESGYAATADNGTSTTNFMWMGINNSGFSNSQAYTVGAAGDGNILSLDNNLDIANGTAGKKIIFYTGGTATANQRVAIDGVGNVGIGTVNPTALLNVSGGYGTNAALIVNQLNNGDLFTASSAGITKFRIQNNGTITDANYVSCTGVTSDASGNMSCNTNAFANVNFWQLNGTTLSPGNSIYDLAIGGNATSSALFQVSGTTGNASMAGTLTTSTIQSPTGPLTFNYKSGANSWAAALTIQPTTGNIGVGTTNPVAPLQITGGFGSNAALIVNNLNSGDLFTASSAGITKFRIQNNGTITDANYVSCTGVTSDASGNMSCNTNAFANVNFWQLNGTTLSPGNSIYDLAIGGTSTSSAKFQVFGASGDASMSGNLYLAQGSAIRPASGPLELDYKSGPNAWSAGLIIQPGTGNVGIGVANPTARLDIGGSTSSITNTTGDITIGAASGNVSLNGGKLINFAQTLGTIGTVTIPTYSFSGDTSTGMYDGGAGLLRLTTNGANRLAIDNNGLVGIGTITPTSLLTVNGGYGANAALIVNQLNNADLMSASASGTTRFRVDYNGNVIASSFLDSANTSYLLDPANAGTSLALAGSVAIGGINPIANTIITASSSSTTKMILDNTGNLDINGTYSGLTGTNTRIQATGNVTGATGSGSIYFVDSTGVSAGRYEAAGKFGTGTDGAYTITSSSNCQTGTGQFTTALCKATNITAITNTTKTTLTVASTTGFLAGDEVFLIQMLGTGAGNYETHYITSVTNSTTLQFGDVLKNVYQATNAQAVRIPQFTSLTVNNGGTVTTSAWNGTTGGVLFFRATGNVTIASGGAINMNGLGGAGGSGGGSASGGSAACAWNIGANGTAGGSGGAAGVGVGLGGGAAGGSGGGGAGGGGGIVSGGGAGGGVGGGGAGGTLGNVSGAGSGGSASGGAGGNGSAGAGPGGGGAAGTTQGDSNFIALLMGSGGGGGGGGGAGGVGGCWSNTNANATYGPSGVGGTGGSGGAGGGIISISARSVVNSGSITSNGLNGSSGGAGGNATNAVVTSGGVSAGGSGGGASGGAGGGGSGGSILLLSSSVTPGTLTITAGSGGVSSGANGGNGSVGGTTGGAAAGGGGGGGGGANSGGAAAGAAGGNGAVAGSNGGSGGGSAGGGAGSVGRTLTKPNYGTLYTGAVDLTNADLAEYYVTGDKTISPGDVVIMQSVPVVDAQGEALPNKGVLYKSSHPYDVQNFGIISTEPGLSLGNNDGSVQADNRAVALSGRVPIKIASTSAAIRIGDYLTSSFEPGKAMKATKAGYAIAKALEDWNPGGGNTINAFVNPSYYDPDANLMGDIADSYTLQSIPSTGSGSLTYQIQNMFGELITRAITLSQAMIANLTAGAINAHEIATDSLSIGGQKIQDLINTLVDQRLSSQSLVSPIASNSAAENLMSLQKHADNSENLMIKIGSIDASNSGTNTLTIADRYSNPVATIDEAGNASFSGNLTAKNATFGNLTLNDASISGILYANQIEGLRAKVSSIIADQFTGNQYLVATSSSDLITSLTDTNSDILTRISELEAKTNASNSGYLASSAFESISIGSTLLLDNTGINSTADTLNIQGSGHGTVSLLAGAMTLDSNGLIVNTDAYFAKSVTIKEDLMVDVIKSLNGDIAIHLATASSDLSDRLAILNNRTEEVASIDASGSAKFNKLMIASDREDPNTTATISGQYRTNASTGQSQLAAGAKTIRIVSPKIGVNSLIYVTPTSSTSNEVLYVSSKYVDNPNILGDTSYFTVTLDSPLAVPVSFNWWIIN